MKARTMTMSGNASNSVMQTQHFGHWAVLVAGTKLII